jgi:hypothetical protein
MLIRISARNYLLVCSHVCLAGYVVFAVSGLGAAKYLPSR